MATSDRKKRYWGVVAPTMPADVVAQSAKQQEELGLEGTFAAQVYGPPFIPLAAAATTTTRLLLASGIALAFVRSPFETAMAAMDLDRMSGGRFILGLGSSIRAWSEGFFGMPFQEGVKQRDYRSVAHLVPDDMASTFVVTGTPSEVRQKLEPVWEGADSVCLIPPLLSLEPAQLAPYFMTVAETFYS